MVQKYEKWSELAITAYIVMPGQWIAVSETRASRTVIISQQCRIPIQAAGVSHVEFQWDGLETGPRLLLLVMGPTHRWDYLQLHRPSSRQLEDSSPAMRWRSG